MPTEVGALEEGRLGRADEESRHVNCIVYRDDVSDEVIIAGAGTQLEQRVHAVLLT